MSASSNLEERLERALSRNSAPALFIQILAEAEATPEMAQSAVLSLGSSVGKIDAFVAAAVLKPNAMRHPSVAYLVGLVHTRLSELILYGTPLQGAAWSAFLQGLAERGLLDKVAELVRQGVPPEGKIPLTALAHILSHPDMSIRMEGIRAAARVKERQISQESAEAPADPQQKQRSR